LCWLLLVPLVIILAGWWRDRIDTLALIGAPGSTILAWSSRNNEGVTGRIGHIAAGAVLLLQGGQSVLARRINQLALIREIAGQRARSKASARVRDDEASGRFAAITLHEADRLSPHGRPQGTRGTFAVPGFDGQPQLAGRLVAVVGERGLGKTTAIETLLADLSPPRQMVLRTGTQGFAGLVTAMADELQCAPSPDAIAAALQTTGYAIAVDDVQRLVVPAIGGLDDFDRLIALARASGVHAGADPGADAGGRTSWLFAIGGPAWSYLARARADRTIFDDVLHLKRWGVTEIRALVERRTEQAGMAPLFNLDIHNAGTMLFDSDISPEERVRRQYFDELTEHAAGNPAVALEFWRRSLFHDCEAGTVAVRTYRLPDSNALLALPRASLFVLRAVLQMEIATLPNIALSTDLPMVVIRDSLRVLTQLGVIGESGDGFRLTLFWFQDVRRLLRRQNLVVGRLS
jgi:predicted transcriptional regulator